MKKFARLPVAVTAACLSIGLVAAPSADAATGHHKKSGVSVRKVNADLKKVRKRTTNAEKNIQAIDASIVALQSLAGGANGKADTILAGVPAIINGLGALRDGSLQLKDGLEKAAAGITALKSALETQIGPNLKKVGDALTAQEYGVTSILLGPGSANTFLPLGVTSGDIPDDGNTTSASGELPLVAGDGTGGTVPAGMSLVLRSAIRSGESDGGATGPAAGYVGGLMTMKCAGGTSANIPGGCDVNGGAAGGDVPAGALVCVVGPPASTQIPTPSGNTTAFVVPIQQKSGRGDLSKPSAGLDAATVNPLEGAADGQGPLVDNANHGCKVGGSPGDAYTLNVQTQFLDPPATTTPGPTE